MAPPWFYPVGNTPPVCLTQNLPPGLDAALLLLGCGDFRSILFTTYSESKTSISRRLDFTCCDIAAEIIARNVLALSIIVDDVQGERIQQLWNIYYHVFLDTDSARILRLQAQKLMSVAGSLGEWVDGPYAGLIRFCDGTTLKAVAALWHAYAIDPTAGSAYKDAQSVLKKEWTAAKRYHETSTPNRSVVLAGVRSVAPLVSQALKTLPKLHQEFWKSGTFLDGVAIKQLTTANPMFMCHRKPLALHYATNPLAGYHLAPAYADLAAESPLRGLATTGKGEQDTTSKAMQSAIDQLSHWCAAFREAVPRVTIRFVNSDALAFCHVLKHRQKHGETRTAYTFRSTWTYEPLLLDAADYAEAGTGPTTFDVIDTSNLMDHLGCLNLLTATCPLLKRACSSNIRTEILKPKEGSLTQSANKILCGHLPTVALLLGLKPVQYWTNATAAWRANTAAANKTPALSQVTSDEMDSVMSRPIVLWRRLDTSLLHYDPIELAQLLLSLYLDMFQDESWAHRIKLFGLGDAAQRLRKLNEYEVYTRASFVVLLRHIKDANVTHWDDAMDFLVSKGVFRDETLDMGPHHVQSLLVHLETMRVWMPENHLRLWHPRSFQEDLKGRFANWKNIPATVCVTLVVPHRAVALLGDVYDSGTPICQLQLHSSVSSTEAFYPDIQLGFGSVSATGTPYSDEYALTMQEDGESWQGSSPLIVSAMVSTGSLVDEGDPKCRVAFALKSTPTSSAKFFDKLGFRMFVHESAVGQRDVFVTRYRPNMKGHTPSSTAARSPPVPESHPPPRGIMISPIINADTKEITRLRIRFEIASGEGKALLQNAGTVALETADPFRLLLTIDRRLITTVPLPLPITTTNSKTKIARKSLWIEYTAAVAHVSDLRLRADSVFPMLSEQGLAPTLENLHYIHPDVLPKLDNGRPNANADWLGCVVSPMATMAREEYKLYKLMLATKDAAVPGRLGIKESTQGMYAHLFGLGGQPRGTVFRLGRGTMHFGVLFVDSVRMDLGNQSVIIDAALLPHYAGAERESILCIANANAGPCIGVEIQDAEIAFWKHLLPTFAERCRQWEHKPLCEFAATGRMPLADDDDGDEHGRHYMCSCGVGVFPDGYLKSDEKSQLFLRQAVRVAIPVLSASPIQQDERDPQTAVSRSADGKKDGKPAGPCVEDMAAKRNGCLGCGAGASQDGQGSLQRCATCRIAQYCSAACQKKDWKSHKQVCKQVQGG